MRITKLLKYKFSLLAIIILLISASACKKDKTQPEVRPALYGDWQELSLNAGFQRIISFRSNNSFKMDVVNLIPPSVIISTYTGTYTLKNDSVKVNVTEEKVVKDKVLVSNAAVSINLYDKGAYRVENNVLTLKYITYPADAPVNTEAKIRRLLE
jgi:hypothetical protein